MIVWFKIILILTLHKNKLESNILDDEKVKLSLQYLCPGVDICNKNTSDPKVNPKETNERQYVSCCHGCSCHKECHLNSNCCFPDDIEDIPNSNTSSTFESGFARFEQGHSSLTRNQNDSQSKEDNTSVDTNEKVNGIRDETMDNSGEITAMDKLTTTVNKVDKDNASIAIDFAVKQCMYTRTGIPDETWVARVPAFRIVASPPPAGCQSNTLCPTLTQQSKQPTCNSEDVFPWGDFFPVYSANYNLIFKNELCACCYGVIEYTPWYSFLECEEHDTNNQRDIPISEHLGFLQQSNQSNQSKLPDNCMMAFDSVGSQVLLEHQCFMHTVGTCRISAEFLHRVPDAVNLTSSEINEACTSGPDAPFVFSLRVYKNVFCAMCNMYQTVQRLQCVSGDGVHISKQFGRYTLIFLLDTTSIQKLTQVGKRDQISTHPMACLKDKGQWIEESCRAISCSSGKIRIGGVCTFPSKIWMFRRSFEIIVKLKYITSNTSVLRMLTKEEVMTDEIVNALRKTKPWPSDWIITKLFNTTKIDQFSTHLVVHLSTEISNPERLNTHIKESMRRPWIIVLNGMGIAFEQSCFQYQMKRVSVNEYEPRWLMYAHEFETYINISVNEPTSWKIMFDVYRYMSPFYLNKLVTCEQILLLKNEYTIMAEGLILLNKLTNEIMFSLEYELYDVDGELVPRICLTDSPFVLRMENNGAPTLSIKNLNLVWVIYILQWALKHYCAPVSI